MEYLAGQQNVRLKTWWCPHEEVNMHKTAGMHSNAVSSYFLCWPLARRTNRSREYHLTLGQGNALRAILVA